MYNGKGQPGTLRNPFRCESSPPKRHLKTCGTQSPRFQSIQLLPRPVAFFFPNEAIHIGHMWMLAALPTPSMHLAPPGAAQVLRLVPPIMLGGRMDDRYMGRVEPTMMDHPGMETILLEGREEHTWSYDSPPVDQVQVVIGTEDGTYEADVELFSENGGIPCKMTVWAAEGPVRPFSAVLETPRGLSTLAVRNLGDFQDTVAASVVVNEVDMPSPDCLDCSVMIEGMDVRSIPCDLAVDSVQVALRTDGRPLDAKIEVVQGRGEVVQVIDLYTEEAFVRPFFCLVETPGPRTEIRIINNSPIEFPLTAGVAPNTLRQGRMGRGYQRGGQFLDRGPSAYGRRRTGVGRASWDEFDVYSDRRYGRDSMNRMGRMGRVGGGRDRMDRMGGSRDRMGGGMGYREPYMDMDQPWNDFRYDYRSDYHRYGADNRRGYGAMDFDIMRGGRNRVASDQPATPTFGARGSVAAATTATPYSSSRSGEYGDYVDPYSYRNQRDRRGLGSIGRATTATLPSTYAQMPHMYRDHRH